ncbi:uncharacterized protein LOC141874129 [Acropora palmata]|uniref:uncharacterized protein LOC141874129 n=1 Tax=Acropora palmata TaxID=6131 RepID=UPI003D9FD16C
MMAAKDRLLIACFFCFVICFFTNVVGTLDGNQITYPERIDGKRPRSDLSTSEKGGHVRDVSYRLTAFDKDWTLDLKNNKKIISPSFAMRTFDENGLENIEEAVYDDCHYQGTIRGVKDSSVVLNTCKGLRGVLDDGKDTFYIAPVSGYKYGAHSVFQTKEQDSSDVYKGCGNGDVYTEYHVSGDTSGHFSTIRRGISNMDDFYRPYLTTNETRYNELVLVADHRMYLDYNNDTATIKDRVITLVNAVDAIYQRINIRIVLKALEIWTNGDPYEREIRGGPDLGKFNNYRNAHLQDKFPHDNAQLLSQWSWSDCAGMAYVSSMCGRHSAGVNRWSMSSIIGPYVTVAHEMGHNFGFSHDSGNCKCLTPRGCIMGGHKTRVPGFSNCSLASLKKINDKCLFNVPTYQALNSYCGNGIREEGEECDCGTPEICKAKDHCCEPHNCVLKKSSQCSDLHHGCCENCLFKKQGTLCRGVKTDCDVPEYCTGGSRDCPADSYIVDGFPCNQTKTVVQGSTNYNSVFKRQLNPRPNTRYLRLSPQYWHGWPCLRVDFLGCSKDEVHPTAPTPLKSYLLNYLCLTPSSKTCSPNDTENIIYARGDKCDGKHFQFTLESNGVLRHSCSGKMVCPTGSGNGASLVVSSSCLTSNSKFERTQGHSLKHLKTGKCIHTHGGWPGEDKKMVLWSLCDEMRLEIWFVKQDCVDRLGMESGYILDNQITASSYRPADLPQYGRLHNNKYWCAGKNSKDEYFQVDLGQEKTVNEILIQGRSNWYDWVTGFHLYFSDDGQQWTGYSQSGDKNHSNSVCYLGKCSEIHETQCKDLWGATARNAHQGCYKKLNTELSGYGTCDPTTNTSCALRDVLCGQLQCEDLANSPVADYGWSYKKITLDNGKMCNAATLKFIESAGLGMVRDGTKCDTNKICVDFKCQSYDQLNISKCPSVAGKECGGRGVCTNEGKCYCQDGFDPKDSCSSVTVPRNGAWGEWSSWTVCDKGCGTGKRKRHRFCDNPFPLHGGKDCPGHRQETEDCNTENCPVGISCRHLQQIGQEKNRDYPDGVYKINPTGSEEISTYCDMSRDGGGWTLLVASHTNSWTKRNVYLRNENTPTLNGDFSILEHADNIKNNFDVAGSKFEYRLEAQKPDRWGGIWRTQRSYTFVATNTKQTDIELVKKFDDWEYSNSGIEKRMPWISGARLTTSENAYSSWWGTITADDPFFHPAPWMNGHLQESQPSHIWYWVREGPFQFPRSCMEVNFRGLLTNPVSDGIFTIKPPGLNVVKTYCDFTTAGGPWTLLLTSKTHRGWDKNNVKQRNVEKPSLNEDFSILGFADAIKDVDKSQEYFQYRIEADKKTRWGGIWEAPRDYSFLSTSDKQTEVKLINKFDLWDESGNNLSKRMPRLGLTNDLLLSSASVADDISGTLVYNKFSKDSPIYLKENPFPTVVRYWMREGARLSCNDLKVHGLRAGNTYDDGFQMIRINGHYLPVYCDMTTSEGAFTLVVTSAHNNWTRAEVPLRNKFHPGLDVDYSILNLADIIKNLSNNGSFQYMLDAKSRRHWGGIFQAPSSYSFMATNNKQTNVQLIRKFDHWEYSWWKSLNPRMPWFDAKGTGRMALLTTSDSPTYYPSGSILWAGTDRHPADWILDYGMRDPGVIWYWVNEDDCDEDRKPVNGKLSQWSDWTRCDKLCEHGKERRYKTCSNPKPRCGGKNCDLSISVEEERPCVYCPESGIRSYGDYCVAPNTGGCSPPDGAYLILTKKRGTACNQTDMIFVLDWDGVIHHKCSKKVVCPQDNNPTYGHKLMLKDKCDLSVYRHERLSNLALKNLRNGFCVHPSGGWPNEGGTLVYWQHCKSERLKLDFFKLDPPSVEV